MTSPRAPSVVLLTGPGRAAVASLLVEGDEATSVVAALFHPAGRRTLANCAVGQIVVGRWQSSSQGEQVVVCRRDARKIEIHCHGGRAAARAIIDSLLERGCREITWQEWVRQSAPDPLAADARIALAAAPTERTAMILHDQHAGALARAVGEVRELVAVGRVERAIDAIDKLLGWSALGLHLVAPWEVVLAGRPNVGKSSLINALVGYQRAIVHPTPGTTRDVVTAAAAWDGWPAELADTAGLRAGGAALESAGIELARDMLVSADLVVLVFDGSQPFAADDATLLRDWPRALRVVNKCDLPLAPGTDVADAIRSSAVRGDGLEELGRAIVSRLVPHIPPPGQGVPFLKWHVDALQAARAALAAGQIAQAVSVLAQFAHASKRGHSTFRKK